MWDRSYRAHFSHAAETSNNAPSVSRTERRVIRAPAPRGETARFPGRASIHFSSGLVGGSLAGEKAGMKLPKQFRHTFDEFVATAKQALKQLQAQR